MVLIGLVGRNIITNLLKKWSQTTKVIGLVGPNIITNLLKHNDYYHTFKAEFQNNYL